MAGAVMAEDASRLAPLVSWCGMALIAAGVLMVLATLLHPSRETATTIVAGEPRLVAAHLVYTLARLLVLLGLPGLYAAQRGRMGQLGLVGFLTAFSGTYLIAVTGNFGFLAPVLAKQSPAVLDSINQYLLAVGAPAPFFDRRLGDRDPGQRKSRRRPGLAWLPAVAHTGRFRCVAFR